MEGQARFKAVEWSDVRSAVIAVNPDLGKIIDSINPGKELALYVGTYPYGYEYLKSGKFFIPDKFGRLVALASPECPQKIQGDLEYNLGSNPVSLVLEKAIEIFYLHENHTIPIYGLVRAGSLFSTWKPLSDSDSHGPAFLWNITSGARSIVPLSKAANSMSLSRIEKRFKLQLDKPKNMLQYWNTFKSLANHPEFPEKWESKVLFFGKQWFENLNDKAFLEFHLFLFKNAWGGSNFYRHQYIWELIYSVIQRKLSIKPEPYILENVKHSFAIGVGESPGFSAAINDDAAPISSFSSIYEDTYKIEKYSPIFMVPEMFDFRSPGSIVYYSLSYPTTTQFSTRRTESSKIKDLYLIKSLQDKYISAILENDLNLSGTPMYELMSSAEFSYYHTSKDHFGIHDTNEIFEEDERLKNLTKEREAPSGSPFLRGCMRIKSIISGK